ncbi:MAG: hypothetical protein R3E68_05960 [Burkholderiaceae bacterium]
MALSDQWGGFGLYPSRAAAEAVFNSPDAYFTVQGRPIEEWHALVIPYAHRGGVKLRDEVQNDSAIKVAQEDPKGPLVILTTAGYTSRGPAELPRIIKFFAGIEAVLAFYSTHPGNLRLAHFLGAGVDGRDGLTMTLWRDDESMYSAAYQEGEHRRQLNIHRDTPLFDRSSFTRARVVSSKGTWDGLDPVKAIP